MINNMKRLYLYICSFFFLLPILFSCKEEEKIVYDKDVKLTVSNQGIMLNKDGGKEKITISSLYYWKIYGSSDWCTLDIDEGTPGEAFEVEISAEKNESQRPRYSEFVIKSGYDEFTIVVLQPGTEYKEPDKTGMEHSAKELFYSINNGWNLGNTMEAYDASKIGTGESMETAWGNPIVTKELMQAAFDKGFDCVRIPCGWQNQLIDGNNPNSLIHPNWIKRVKEVVDYCMEIPGMKVFLNLHHCEWLEKGCSLDSLATSEPRVFNLWYQVAMEFRDYDERLILGATNEPVADNSEQATILCKYEQAFINAVRGTGGKNAYRKIVYQAPNTNCEYALSFMKSPIDYVPGLMGMEVHFYSPITFCMEEDADWGYASYFWGKDYMQEPVMGIDRNAVDNEDYVDNLFPKLKEKFVVNGIPIFVGEYGAEHKNFSSPTIQKIHDESYVHYHKYIVSKMKENGLVPFVWDTGGIIDRTTYQIGNELEYNAIKEGAKTNYPTY